MQYSMQASYKRGSEKPFLSWRLSYNTILSLKMITRTFWRQNKIGSMYVYVLFLKGQFCKIKDFPFFLAAPIMDKYVCKMV